jgi:hypothetical protein
MCKKNREWGRIAYTIQKRCRSNDQGIESYYRERKKLAMRNIQKIREKEIKPFGVPIIRHSLLISNRLQS